MMAHTFRGSTWRSLVGLESARTVFERYRALRAREREYVDWPDPLGDAVTDGPAPSSGAPWMTLRMSKSATPTPLERSRAQ
jgi:hypothetical protein